MLFVQLCQAFFSHGGVMKRARQETLAFLKAGHDVIVITDLRWTSHMYQFSEFKSKLRVISVKPLYIFGFRNISSQFSFTLKLFFILRSLIRKYKIDLIITHQTVSSYAIVHIAKKNKIKTALVIQDIIRYRIETGNPYNRLETILFRHSNRYAFKKMDYNIVVSKLSRELLILEGAKPESILIKYNSVDTNLFSSKQPEVKKLYDLLFIGRLSVEKGIDILIESTNYFQKPRKILIIGEGPLREKLRNQASKVKDHFIEFLGFVDYKNLPDYIQKAHIVVAPSRSECQASVPLESMACGVPVIASKVSGMEDMIIHNKTGWLLENNDPKTLGDLVEELFSKPERIIKAGESAVKHVQLFSESKFFSSIIDFYEKLAL